jgi:predicted deacylase
MELGNIAASPGEKAFGFFETGKTHGRFPVHIPLHIVAGAAAGPTLLVQAGASGLEVEPALTLPGLVSSLDPAGLAGTLIVAPLLNTSGFEFEQANAVWDDKDLNALGRGDPNGTVSEQMIDRYYREVVARADAVIDVRTGAQWSYHRYAGVFRAGDEAASRALAVALGLPQVLLGQRDDGSSALEAARDGKAVASAWIGGGPGLRDYRADDQADDQRRLRNAVHNALIHLGMMEGEPAWEGDRVSVLEAHTYLEPSGERGFTFIDKAKRGTSVAAGEALGHVRHPFSGEHLEEVTAPRAGVMLHAGASWPVVPEGVTLAILGDPVDEVTP